MNDLDSSLAQVVGKLTTIVQAHGAQAIDLGGTLLRAEAAYDIIWPIGLSVAACVWAKVACFLTKKFKEADNDLSGNEIGWLLATTAAWIATGIIGIVSVISLITQTLNPVLWLAVSSTYYALAAKVLGLL